MLFIFRLTVEMVTEAVTEAVMEAVMEAEDMGNPQRYCI